MGDISRMREYERNTNLDGDDVLKNCIKRCYAKERKEFLLDLVIDKISEEILSISDDQSGDKEIFEWVMLYGTKKEKAFIDDRLCDKLNPLWIDTHDVEKVIEELPKYKKILESGVLIRRKLNDY
tara:strand:- start:559 stop:933 length:375 start_codon:yes stop_codon:yes gene_type:complete